MLEGVLALAGEAAAGARHQQVLLLELGERRRRGPGPPRRRPRSAIPPRRSARRRRRAAAAGARSRSRESSLRRQQRLDRAGQRRRLDGVLLDQAVHHLLGEQRVAAGALGDLRDDLGACRSSAPGISAATSSRVSSAVSGSSEIVVALRRPPPQPGPALEQLVARQADQQQRAAHPARQVVDQVEHPLVGPVDVVDREHQRAAAGDRLDRRRGPPRTAPRASAGDRRRLRPDSSGGSIPSGIASSAALRSPASGSPISLHQRLDARAGASPTPPPGVSVSSSSNSSRSTSTRAR